MGQHSLRGRAQPAAAGPMMSATQPQQRLRRRLAAITTAVVEPQHCHSSDAGQHSLSTMGPDEIAEILQKPTAPKDASGNYIVKVGIIGGSGLDDPDIMSDQVELKVDTPYGPPSDSLMSGTIGGVAVVLLARHGRSHTIMPTNVNFRANIFALKAVGCTHVVVSTAVGILQPHIAPGELALLDQFIDRTTKRASTYYDGAPGSPGGVCHIPQAEPFCSEARATVLDVAASLGLRMHETATVVSIEGPRFSSRAESRWFSESCPPEWHCLVLVSLPWACGRAEVVSCVLPCARRVSGCRRDKHERRARGSSRSRGRASLLRDRHVHRLRLMEGRRG
eukprot:COSAG01_NODE_4322_length_5133_cov_8.546285_2_plen_336_part_00